MRSNVIQMQIASPVERKRLSGNITQWETLPPLTTDFWESLSAPFAEGLKCWCWLAAKRLGLVFRATRIEVKYSSAQIDLDEIVQATWRHALDICDRTGKPPKEIVMGQSEFAHLGRAIHTQFPGDHIAPVYSSNPHERPELMYQGMKITVLPWMEGIVALPDD